MNLSYGHSEINLERFRNWSFPFTTENSCQTIYTYEDDIYDSLQVSDFTDNELQKLQAKVRIISGLYGILRPLDLIQPYRLEMDTKLITKRGSNIYEFWKNILTSELNNYIIETNEKYLINLASNEYIKAIKTDKIAVQVITPVFKEFINGAYRVISVSSKRARGLMTRYIIKNNIENIEDIKKFDQADYCFAENLSSNSQWIFTRNK